MVVVVVVTAAVVVAEPPAAVVAEPEAAVVAAEEAAVVVEVMELRIALIIQKHGSGSADGAAEATAKAATINRAKSVIFIILIDLV